MRAATEPGVATIPMMGSLEDIARMVVDSGDVPLYVRFSAGPEADERATSRDEESGCQLPGLIVSPLMPEPWWNRSIECWVAHQLSQYLDFDSPIEHRIPWILTGQPAGRGPRCELLVADVRPVALIDPTLVIKSLARI